MLLGEKLWEGTGKTQTMTTKDTNPNGATFEYTWIAKLKGMGKAKTIDITLSFTGTKTADFFGAGPTTGDGVFFTKDGNMVAVKSSGYGKPQSGKGKSIEIWSFTATAQALSWLNSTIAIVTIQGDDQWKQFNLTISEWNSS